MTVSTHVYAAYLVGSPDIALKVKGGSLTLDAGQAPHVSGTVDIAVPIMSTLTALDPRLSKRIRVDVSVTSPSFSTVTRSFNLGLRNRDVRHVDGVVSLAVASDVALLQDYAPLADDDSAFAYQSSIRGVINYVLGKAITGTSLAVSPASDANITTYADSTNLIPDPSIEFGGSGLTGQNVLLDAADTSWAADGTKSLNLYSPSSNDSYVSIGTGSMPLGLNAGRRYMFSATGNVKVLLSGEATRSRCLTVFYRVGQSTPIAVDSPKVANTVGAASRVKLFFTLPPGTTEVFVRAYNGGSAGQIRWDAFRLSEASPDPADTGFYSGDTADTSGYDYFWSGPTHPTTSLRRALINRPPEALLWRAGQSALDFLAPLVQAAGFRLVCDESRVWTLRDENYTAPGALNIRHGINLIDGTDTIARDSGIWFDAAVTTYIWQDSNGDTQTAVDAYALTNPYTRFQTFERTTPYPGAGFSEYAVRRSQQRGREVSAAAVADWTGRAEQPITIMLSGAPTQIGETTAVQFDLDRDEMTVTTRTTDTPVGAIDLLAGTINGLTGTINGL